MILAQFVYDEERASIIDYICPVMAEKLISILSSPQITDHDSLIILKAFRLEVWLAIMISFLIICSINAFRTSLISEKIYLALDYFDVLLGHGKDSNKDI
jgi:hypothetical protein